MTMLPSSNMRWVMPTDGSQPRLEQQFLDDVAQTWHWETIPQVSEAEAEATRTVQPAPPPATQKTKAK